MKIKNENNLEELAFFILNEYDVKSALKLQKLVFFCRREEVIENKKTNIENSPFKNSNNFEAWINGPVAPEVYERFRPLFWGMDEVEAYFDKNKYDSSKFTSYRKTLDKYNEFSANELVQMTHELECWIKARGNLDKNEPSKEKIDENLILEDSNKSW